MGKWRITEYKTTRKSKGKLRPYKIESNCDICGSPIILTRTSKGRFNGRSESSTLKILQSIQNNEEIEIICSIACSNRKRDHSYMNNQNKVHKIFCKDCNEECKYRDESIHYGSKAIKCYTAHNKNFESVGFTNDINNQIRTFNQVGISCPKTCKKFLNLY